MKAKRFLALQITIQFCIIFILSVASAQPYAIGNTTLTFTDSSRNNRSIGTNIYYPAQQAGANVAMAAGSAKFPVISIGHGFVMSVDAYFYLRDMLVPEGYIVALPTTEGGFSPSHANFGKDLAFVIESLMKEGGKLDSRFFNRVDSMNCVMGHSMGGGAAHLAAAGSSIIKAIATLAAAETNPSAIAAAGNLSIPALVFAGANDCVTSPNTNQLPMYNALKSICKTYISITGGGHCFMANNNAACSFGESTCSPAPTISRAQQHAIIKSYLIPWLNYQLKNNCNSGADFESLLKSDSKITYQSNCTYCVTSDAPDVNATLSPTIFPNPFDQNIHVARSSFTNGPVEISIKGLDGKTHFLKNYPSINISGNPVRINTNNLPQGYYFLQIKDNKQNKTYPLIKR